MEEHITTTENKPPYYVYPGLSKLNIPPLRIQCSPEERLTSL